MFLVFCSLKLKPNTMNVTRAPSSVWRVLALLAMFLLNPTAGLPHLLCSTTYKWIPTNVTVVVLLPRLIWSTVTTTIRKSLLMLTAAALALAPLPSVYITLASPAVIGLHRHHSHPLLNHAAYQRREKQMKGFKTAMTVALTSSIV